MNNFLKNILLLIIILIISCFVAEYFGDWYDNFISGSLGDGAWMGTVQTWHFLIGAPLAYIFFTILLFKLVGSGDKNKWAGWLLVPPFLFFGSGDLKHIYLPIWIAVVAWGMAEVAKKMFKIN